MPLTARAYGMTLGVSSDVHESIRHIHARLSSLESRAPALAGWSDWIPTNGASKEEKALLDNLNQRLATLERYHEFDGPLLLNVRDNVVLHGALVQRLADRVEALEAQAPPEFPRPPPFVPPPPPPAFAPSPTAPDPTPTGPLPTAARLRAIHAQYAQFLQGAEALRTRHNP